MTFDAGVWNYIASTGATTHVISGERKLLTVRFFANGADGTVYIYPRTDTTGLSSAAPIAVRSGVGFDWTPSAKVKPVVLVVSSAIDVFGEVSS